MSFDISFYLYSALTSYIFAFLFSMFLDLHTLKTSENHSFPDVFMGGVGGAGGGGVEREQWEEID